MKYKGVFFCIYKQEDNDLKILTIEEDIKGLSSYLDKPKSTLYRLGVKKKQGVRVYLTINGQNYVIIVDRD